MSLPSQVSQKTYEYYNQIETEMQILGDEDLAAKQIEDEPVADHVINDGCRDSDSHAANDNVARSETSEGRILIRPNLPPLIKKDKLNDFASVVAAANAGKNQATSRPMLTENNLSFHAQKVSAARNGCSSAAFENVMSWRDTSPSPVHRVNGDAVKADAQNSKPQKAFAQDSEAGSDNEGSMPEIIEIQTDSVEIWMEPAELKPPEVPPDVGSAPKRVSLSLHAHSIHAPTHGRSRTGLWVQTGRHNCMAFSRRFGLSPPSLAQAWRIFDE
mmetsp:Transcript_55369/g.135647  ORF Transcript_55369/g.135647 Transcript_55369/m.135647 type:complete len:272 (+) Transcript_55369:241-1056(+)